MVAVQMGDEDRFESADFQRALLQLVLRRFTTVEKIPAPLLGKLECQCRNVALACRFARGGAQKGESHVEARNI
ncbi:hypothetical protein D1872_333190 [compost metagenome]